MSTKEKKNRRPKNAPALLDIRAYPTWREHAKLTKGLSKPQLMLFAIAMNSLQTIEAANAEVEKIIEEKGDFPLMVAANNNTEVVNPLTKLVEQHSNKVITIFTKLKLLAEDAGGEDKEKDNDEKVFGNFGNSE